MILTNTTDQDVFYGISAPGMADCGSLKPNSVKEVGYDNLDNVRVSFFSLNEYRTFETTFQQTSDRNVVTLALSFAGG